jgi:methyl-accepting chemotaxis protein
MLRFKDLRISTKLIIGFLFVAFIAAVVGVVGLINIIMMKNSDAVLYESNTKSLEYAGAAEANLQQLRYDILKTTTLSDAGEIKKLLDEADQLSGEVDTLIQKCEEAVDTDNLKNQITTINATWSSYKANLISYKELLAKGDIEGSKNLAFNTMAPKGVQLKDNFLKLFNSLSEEAGARADRNAGQALTAMIMMLVIMAAAILIAILLGTGISRSIGRPITKMEKAAEMLSVGNMAVDQVLNEDGQMVLRRDEIGGLAKAFSHLVEATKLQVESIQRLAAGDLTTAFIPRSEEDQLSKGLADMTQHFNQLIGSIIMASEQVLSGSDLVANSSMVLSQGATEQASAIQQLTASLEEIAAQTSANAQNADKADALALHTRNNADQGNNRMNDMLTAMEAINQSSQSINKIIKVIDDIAFQTNILALNAAVEAARAGQHGKGFAVVAEEVRTLAARSANAVKETTTLIENSIGKVEAGTKIAGDTAKALNEIVREIEAVADLVSAISKASGEQAAGIQQINSGLIQVSQVVQTNAATAEESAAASEELSGQARQLKDNVSIFRINDVSAGTADVPHRNQLPSRGLDRAGRKAAALVHTAVEADFGKY